VPAATNPARTSASRSTVLDSAVGYFCAYVGRGSESRVRTLERSAPSSIEFASRVMAALVSRTKGEIAAMRAARALPGRSPAGAASEGAGARSAASAGAVKLDAAANGNAAAAMTAKKSARPNNWDRDESTHMRSTVIHVPRRCLASLRVPES
jgi:hypothetical protein